MYTCVIIFKVNLFVLELASCDNHICVFNSILYTNPRKKKSIFRPT